MSSQNICPSNQLLAATCKYLICLFNLFICWKFIFCLFHSSIYCTLLLLPSHLMCRTCTILFSKHTTSCTSVLYMRVYPGIAHKSLSFYLSISLSLSLSLSLSFSLSISFSLSPYLSFSLISLSLFLSHISPYSTSEVGPFFPGAANAAIRWLTLPKPRRPSRTIYFPFPRIIEDPFSSHACNHTRHTHSHTHLMSISG